MMYIGRLRSTRSHDPRVAAEDNRLCPVLPSLGAAPYQLRSAISSGQAIPSPGRRDPRCEFRLPLTASTSPPPLRED